MSRLLNYSNIDTEIQRRMAGQAPDENRRLGAINGAVEELYAMFDVETSKREHIFFGIPNGERMDLTDMISDFKNPYKLRYQSPDKQTDEFSNIENELFVNHMANGKLLDEYSISYLDGNQYLQINATNGFKSKVLSGAQELTGATAWTADTTNGDATSVSVESVVTLEQSNDIKFNIDVSQSANNYALVEGVLTTALDLTDYVNLGKIRFWTYLPSITDFTSVEFRWGNDSSNYFSGTATTQVDGRDLIVGWNRVEIDWNGASETGTVDVTDIDYIATKYNYAAGFVDQTGVKFESIEMFLPIPLSFQYYTYYNAIDSSGDLEEDMTANASDTLIIPRRFKNIVVLIALRRLWPMAIGDDAENELNRVEGELEKEYINFGINIGEKPNVNSKKTKIRRQY